MKFRNRTYQLMILSVALSWFMTGTAAAQYFIYEWDTIDDPVPHQGGDYDLYLMTNRPQYVDCMPWWHVIAYDWLTVGLGHSQWYPDYDPGTWTNFWVGVGPNPNDARSGGYEVEYWYDDFWYGWFLEDWDYLPIVFQSKGAPDGFYCDPNPIQISPSGPDVDVTFYVDVPDINVELKYTYEGGPEMKAGPYYAEGGQWTLTYTPEHLSVAGTYVFTSIRNSDGGLWHSINYTIILEEIEGEYFAAAAGPGPDLLTRWIVKVHENRAIHQLFSSLVAGRNSATGIAFGWQDPRVHLAEQTMGWTSSRRRFLGRSDIKCSDYIVRLPRPDRVAACGA